MINDGELVHVRLSLASGAIDIRLTAESYRALFEQWTAWLSGATTGPSAFAHQDQSGFYYVPFAHINYMWVGGSVGDPTAPQVE